MPILYKKPIKAQTGITLDSKEKQTARDKFLNEYLEANQSNAGVVKDDELKMINEMFDEDWDYKNTPEKKVASKDNGMVYVGEEDTYDYSGKTFTPRSVATSAYKNLKSDEEKKNFIWGSYGVGKAPGMPTQDEIDRSKGAMRYIRTKDLMSMPDERIPQQLRHLLLQDKVGVYQKGGILPYKNKKKIKARNGENITTTASGSKSTTVRNPNYSTSTSNFSASIKADKAETMSEKKARSKRLADFAAKDKLKKSKMDGKKGPKSK